MRAGQSIYSTGALILAITVLLLIGKIPTQAQSLCSSYPNASPTPYILGTVNPSLEEDLHDALICILTGTIDFDGQTVSLAYSYSDAGAFGMLFNSDLTLQNGTIDGGNVDFRLLQAIDSYLTLDNMTLQNIGSMNYIDTGSVLESRYSHVTIRNSIFRGNEAMRGGVIYATGSPGRSSMTIENSYFLENRAQDGGAIYYSAAPALMISHSVFRGNQADSQGGAMVVFSSAYIDNSLFSGNHAVQRGGAIFGSGQLVITNSTLSGNAAASSGVIEVVGSPALMVENSIIYGNSHSIEDSWTTYSIVEGFVRGTGNLDVNPLFVNPEPFSSAPTMAGDYQLRPTSPAIDSASNTAASDAGVSSVDLGGNPRFVDVASVADSGEGTAPIIDRGAYEYQPPPCMLYPDASPTPYILGTVNPSLEEDLYDALICITSGTIDFNGQTVWLDYSYSDVGAFGMLLNSDLTLQNGTVDGGNADFRLLQATDSYLTLDNMTLQNIGSLNYIDTGSVLESRHSHVTIRNSIFRGNEAMHGGVIYATGSPGRSSMTIENSHFLENTGGVGGVIYHAAASDLIISRSVFRGNLADSRGGALYLTSDTVIDNSLFSGNRAIGRGGAITSSAPLFITNSTLAGNTANYEGAIDANVAPLVVENSIIYGNSHSIDESNTAYSIVEGFTGGTSNLDVDPHFVNPKPFSFAPTIAGDYQLRPTSPAIDSASNTAASNAGVGSVDLGGNPRFIDVASTVDSGEGTAPIIDMGAYEVQAGLNLDVNDDGIVSPTDAVYVINRLYSGDLSADVDRDNDVDMDDVQAVLDALGS